MTTVRSGPVASNITNDTTVQVVLMVVMMGIERRFSAEQGDKFRINRDLLRCTVTANMLIQTNHLIGRRHDQMQVVGDH